MPPRPRRSFSVSRGRSQRRKLVWATTDQNVSVLGTGNTWSNIDLLTQLESAGSSRLGCTIVRTHLRLAVENWTNVADEVGFGLIVGRNGDIGAGVAGSLNANQLELDWMLLDRLYPGTSGATVDAMSQFSIDNRSKRKMEELGQSYMLSIFNFTAATKTVQVFARTLIALP